MNFEGQPKENELLKQIKLWEENKGKVMAGGLVDFVKDLPLDQANEFQLEVINSNDVGIGALSYVDQSSLGEIVDLSNKMFEAKDEDKRDLARQIAERIETVA